MKPHMTPSATNGIIQSQATVDDALSATEQPSASRLEWLMAWGLLPLVLLAYAPALNAGFIWDDNISLTKCPQIRSLSGLWELWTNPAMNPMGHYYPLTYTSFWLEYRLWGLNAWGYHFVNVLLHGLNAVVLWRVLRNLRIPGALFCAALFALHPLKVESAAWITERKDLLSGFFYLLAALLFLRCAETRNRRDYYASLALSACAMLSKSITLTLPIALGLALWWRNGRFTRQDALRLLPFVTIAAGIAIIGLSATYGFYEYPYELSFIDRCLIASRALWFYLGKLLWPHPLMPIYPRWAIDAADPLQWLPLIGILITLTAFYTMRKRIGRGPLIAALYFGVTLGMLLGFIDYPLMAYSFVADRFQYLAGIGPMALLSGACAVGAAKIPTPQRRMLWIPALGLLLALGAKTFVQTSYFTDNETLFRHNLRYNQTNTYLYDKLGIGLLENENYAEAASAFRRSLELSPGDANVEALLAFTLLQTKEYDTAVELMLKLAPLNPAMLAREAEMARRLLKFGCYREAIRLLEDYNRQNPDQPPALYKLGLCHERLGETEKAEVFFERVRELNPSWYEYWSKQPWD